MDASFKRSYAIVFSQTYQRTTASLVSLLPSMAKLRGDDSRNGGRLAAGSGGSESLVFGLSVQFLNRKSFVEMLVQRHSLLS